MAAWTLELEPVFVGEGAPAGALRPIEVTAVEEVSRGFRVSVTLVSSVGDIDVMGLVRKGATLAFCTSAGVVVRRFTGLVTSARERARRTFGGQEIRVTIDAAMASLERSSDWVIHLGKSSKDIVSAILGARGMTDVTWKLTADPPVREVCTQMNETDMVFVSRLLEEDGIFWYVDQAEAGPRIVFGDSPSAYLPSTRPEVPYADALGTVADEAITTIVERSVLRPSKVTLRDHDFKKPPLDSQLEVSASSSSPFSREHYAYPGRYTVPSEGSRRAALRLQAFEALGTNVELTGFAPSLAAGHWFQLGGTPEGAFDGAWMVTQVAHMWNLIEGRATFRTTAVAIPKQQTFRPLASTPTPRALPCTATVTTASGQEIDSDSFGRVTLKFPWDRRGTGTSQTSSWVRVGQGHTSGAVAVPRLGWEVLVDYEDGDPDKPIILGRVYNPKSPPPTGLPGGKTVTMLQSYSSPGGGGNNSFTMQDAAGGEQLSVHAQKDLNLVVGNNKAKTVTATATYGVVGHETVQIGANQQVKVSATDSLTVSGSQKWSVGAVRSKTVTGDESYSTNASRSVSIGAIHMTTTPSSESTTTSGNLSETVGAVYLQAAALGTAISTAGSCSLTIGGAKIEAVAGGKADVTIGARASTIGGALLNLTPQDVATSTTSARTTTVGGAWMINSGGNAEISTPSSISIQVGGAFAASGTTIVLKVGDSSVTLSGGSTVLVSDEIKLTATGPNAELAPMVGSK